MWFWVRFFNLVIYYSHLKQCYYVNFAFISCIAYLKEGMLSASFTVKADLSFRSLKLMKTPGSDEKFTGNWRHWILCKENGRSKIQFNTFFGLHIYMCVGKYSWRGFFAHMCSWYVYMHVEARNWRAASSSLAFGCIRRGKAFCWSWI